MDEALCKEVENQDELHKGFNTPEEIEPEVLKLQDAVLGLEDEVALRLSQTSWGYLRRGNAYDRPSLVKLQVTPLDVDKTEAPHA